MPCAKTTTTLLPAMLIAACGGSSDNAPAPPTSSGPPPPPLPSVEFMHRDETVLSAASFLTQVSGSTDGIPPDTIDLSCSSGVEWVYDRPIVEFTVPAVAELTEYVCTASVTDSIGLTASDTLTFTVLPETDIGQVVGIFDPPLELTLPNFNLPGSTISYGGHVLAVAEVSDGRGRYQVKGIEGTSFVPRQYHRDDIVLVEGEFQSIDFIQSPSLTVHGLPDASMSIASVLDNKVYWLLQDLQSKDFAIRKEIDVNRPCHMAQPNTQWANDTYVGQVDSGLTVFDIETGSNLEDRDDFQATLIQTVGAGRSLCHIYYGVIPASIVSLHPGFSFSPPFNPWYAPPLTAIDYKTRELVYYGDVDGDNALEEMGSEPIEANASGPLEVIQVISHGTPNQLPRYLLVLLSDGNHIGEHRVVQINFDDDTFEFTQQILHEWSEGAPVAMMQGPFGGSLIGGIFRPDLAVVLGTAEESLFFDNLLPLDAGFGEPPVYGAPTTFTVGTGAGSAVAAWSPHPPGQDDSDFGILVSYPDTGYVVYISLSP